MSVVEPPEPLTTIPQCQDAESFCWPTPSDPSSLKEEASLDASGLPNLDKGNLFYAGIRLLIAEYELSRAGQWKAAEKREAADSDRSNRTMHKVWERQAVAVDAIVEHLVSARTGRSTRNSARTQLATKLTRPSGLAGMDGAASLDWITKRSVPNSQSTNKTRSELLQRSIWIFLERPDVSVPAQIFHSLWSLMITVSVCSAIASGSGLDLPPGGMVVLWVIDMVCTILFTMEFLVKLVVSGSHRRMFLKSVYTWIDVLVISQGFISAALKSVSGPLLLLKTQTPILRLLKIARTTPKWRLLVISMKKCVEPLTIPLYLMVLMVTFLGSLLYWVESNYPDCIVERPGDGCPDGRPPAFLSIPHAMWFVIVTISTVGYGDIYPRSDWGKVIGAFVIVSGVGYLAMPLAIIGSQFGEVWKDRAILLVLDKMKTNMGGKIDMVKVGHIFEEHSAEGEIQVPQFTEIVGSLDIGLTSREIRNIFSAIDDDKSGLISLDEFCEFVERYS